MCSGGCECTFVTFNHFITLVVQQNEEGLERRGRRESLEREIREEEDMAVCESTTSTVHVHVTCMYVHTGRWALVKRLLLRPALILSSVGMTYRHNFLCICSHSCVFIAHTLALCMAMNMLKRMNTSHSYTCTVPVLVYYMNSVPRVLSQHQSLCTTWTVFPGSPVSPSPCVLQERCLEDRDTPKA